MVIGNRKRIKINDSDPLNPSNLGKIKPLPGGPLFKGVKNRLEDLNVGDFFKNDLQKSWEILIKIRNLYCHSFELDPNSKKKIDELKNIINNHGFSNEITFNSSHKKLNVSRLFYEGCLDDFIIVVTKFEIMLNQSHAFENYVLNGDGYIYEELNNMSCVCK